ncbi:MAG: CYTH domain-containing protein [Anaerolineae bacterium]|nr:CYTH domain-containing protein [Anaerolineae bacterium]
MEIEAKFAVPDAVIFRRLQAVDRLAGFVLSTGQTKQVHDTYLDTAERLILAAGYACRRREQEGEVLITLKGLGGAGGAVHRREELEVALPADQPPTQWLASPARERVLQLVGDAPLTPLFELRQTRLVRLVSQGERPVGEWSLDQVTLTFEGVEQAYSELEIELAPQGTEDDLAAIATCLQGEWGLEPQPRSKFERALTFL